jgi:hypothetical protein
MAYRVSLARKHCPQERIDQTGMAPEIVIVLRARFAQTTQQARSRDPWK